ncbi:glycosyltransferase family 2 protein [Synechococcus sp. CCY 9618]|uniref:glycosyltransferase family 2 protein n=1 Tax=Synechococcus sp. CCY 9618 TaxID=2815602 RepID=UPI001C20F83B|nr:glycosyltransferase family 2 protein [Synechococcus sp. CCY 9618]
MRFACVMMQKNETILLDPWIRYHADLVGHENLFIFDNGSTSRSVVRTLKQAQRSGVHVFWEYGSPRHHRERGPLIVDLIQRLDREDSFDFYFLLDCDEFLACQTDAGSSCRRQDLEGALQPFLGSDDVLTIQHKYWHNPCRKDFYALTTSSPKCFFAYAACGYLDHGYHQGRSRLGDRKTSTAIVYFEFHYKPYRPHRISSKQHLSGILQDFSRRSLLAYREKQGFCFHCAVDLLMGKYDYVHSFLTLEGLVEIPAMLLMFDRLGISYGALFEPMPPIPMALYLPLLRIRQGFMHRWDVVIDVLRRGLWSLRRLARGD